MILIVSNSNDPHVDYVLPELKKRKLSYHRFNTEKFPSKLILSFTFDKNSNSKGEFRFPNKRIHFSEIKSVWYRRPLLSEPDPQIKHSSHRRFIQDESSTTLHGIWHNLNCFWINKPDSIDSAKNKILQLRIARELDFVIPKTIVSNNPKHVRDFYFSCNRHIIIKALKTQLIEYGKERSKFLFTHVVKEKDMQDVNLVRFSPCLFQELIPKAADIRVTIFGDKLFSVLLDSQKTESTKIDWRYSTSTIKHIPHPLPQSIQKKCFKLLKYFGLVFGAIDLVLTPNGEYVFLEINPNGQWGWIEEKTKFPLRKSLVDLLQRAAV